MRAMREYPNKPFNLIPDLVRLVPVQNHSPALKTIACQKDGVTVYPLAFGGSSADAFLVHASLTSAAENGRAEHE
jgi:hypothetical protein